MHADPVTNHSLCAAAAQFRGLVARFTPFGGRAHGRVYQRPMARYTPLQETRVED